MTPKPKKEPETFPAILYQLDSTDPYYDVGARFKLEQEDGECYHFKSRPGAELFCNEQGFELVNPEDMERIRAEHAN